MRQITKADHELFLFSSSSTTAPDINANRSSVSFDEEAAAASIDEQGGVGSGAEPGLGSGGPVLGIITLHPHHNHPQNPVPERIVMTSMNDSSHLLRVAHTLCLLSDNLSLSSIVSASAEPVLSSHLFLGCLPNGLPSTALRIKALLDLLLLFFVLFSFLLRRPRRWRVTIVGGTACFNHLR